MDINSATVREFAGKDKLDVIVQLIETRRVLRDLLSAHTAYPADADRTHNAEMIARRLLHEVDAAHQ